MDAFISLPFGISLSLAFWQNLLALPPYELIIMLFGIGGWTILALIFFFMGSELWKDYRGTKYTKNWQWVVLAVDVPALFIQTPKAVEQIFVHLSGAKVSPNVGDKYWKGKKQKNFSFEIVSIEGYIQFLIRTEAEFRDLVEAAIYAQYTEAEITEVEDYVDNIPSHYPHPNYDMFGIEFALEENSAFPIRTYPSFEYNISKDAVFSDPMAAILENFSRIGHGENFWMQIVVEPTNNKWKEEGIELVKTIIAHGGHSGGGHGGHGGGHGGGGSFLTGALSAVMGVAHTIFKEIGTALLGGGHEEHGGGHEEGHEEKKLGDLSPGNRSIVESIEQKISKIGFKTKVRVLYAARKEVFNPSKCLDGFIGAMNQFHIQNSNALVPHHDTSASYLWAKSRADHHKHHFTAAFKKRKLKALGNPYVLNIEELATIWHFPLPFVKTPLIQKAGAKRAEPPMGLPVEATESPLKRRTPVVPQPASPPPSAQVDAPEDLPYG